MALLKLAHARINALAFILAGIASIYDSLYLLQAARSRFDNNNLGTFKQLCSSLVTLKPDKDNIL